MKKRIINGEIDVLLSLYSILLIKIINDIVNKKSSEKKYNLDLMLVFFTYIIITLLKVEGLAIVFCITFAYLIIYRKNKLEFTKKLIFLFLISLLPIIYWTIYSNSFIEMTSARMMLGTGERLIHNFLDFKFLLHLINKILINKQMVISIMIFIFIFSRAINFNEKKSFLKSIKIYSIKKLNFVF